VSYEEGMSLSCVNLRKPIENSPESLAPGKKELNFMVSFMVRLKFTPEDRADVAETLRQLAAASRQEPGCVSYIPHQVEDDPDTVLIYEQYVDAKALAAHRESDHFKKHAVGGLYQKMRERSVENLVAVV
jgi:quinol monooxygenase YgiN